MFRKIWTIIVYSLLVVLCLLTTGARAANIAFVTHEDDPLDALDTHVVTFLEGLGHTVILIDDDEDGEVIQTAAMDADVVFMSESVNETFMRDVVTAIGTPMIVAEAKNWVDMGLSLGVDGVSQVASTNIEIVKPGHFLAAGLSGIVPVLNSTGFARFGMGTAGSQATVIARATLSDGRTYDVIYVYEKGAALPIAPTDGSLQVAAEMRICFGFDQLSIVEWNDNTYTLLEAAVNYAIGATEQAFNPNPSDEQDDVYRDVIMSWTPGAYVEGLSPKHKIFFSEDFNDVNEGVGGATQDANDYLAPESPLDFGKTYYWRVDEANSISGWDPGIIWRFTIEPFARTLPAGSIIATASSSLSANSGPEKTVNRSGLNASDQHDTTGANMWTSATGQQLPVWIQYEFDTVYKLNQMWIWNSNYTAELKYGLGVKTATIEYSTDGSIWEELADVPEFTQAPGTADYEHNTTVDFNGVAAKFVRITCTSSWGGREQCSLSEVRFMYIPVNAWKPDPDDGESGVDINVTLGWRAGRGATEHKVYLSSDWQAVVDGTIPAVTVEQNAYSPLSLDLSQMYYWRVDEVNNSNSTQLWEGSVWSFTTTDYRVVDDFESYNDIPEGGEGSNLVYLTWIDGYDNPSINGSTMGYTSGSSLETTIVRGGCSAPLMYNNITAGISKVTANANDLQCGSDWTIGSPEQLVLWIHGDPNNPATEQIYVEVDGVKRIFSGDITAEEWQQFPIDLASLGTNLSNVGTVTIGLEKIGATGGSGMVFIDDIRLYRPAVAQ
jgi:hypothetical protein